MKKENLMKLLADHGVKRVTVDYSGSGDSGQIGDVVFEGNTNLDLMEVMVERKKGVLRGGVWSEITEKAKASLKEVVQEFCYDQLPGGWEINDGSDGNVVIDVAEDTIKIDHNWHHTDENGDVESTEREEFEL